MRFSVNIDSAGERSIRVDGDTDAERRFLVMLNDQRLWRAQTAVEMGNDSMMQMEVDRQCGVILTPVDNEEPNR